MVDYEEFKEIWSQCRPAVDVEGELRARGITPLPIDWRWLGMINEHKERNRVRLLQALEDDDRAEAKALAMAKRSAVLQRRRKWWEEQGERREKWAEQIREDRKVKREEQLKERTRQHEEARKKKADADAEVLEAKLTKEREDAVARRKKLLFTAKKEALAKRTEELAKLREVRGDDRLELMNQAGQAYRSPNARAFEIFDFSTFYTRACRVPHTHQ